MNEAEILTALLALADEVALRVRPIRGLPGSEGEPAAGSAVVRVRGETWVVLSAMDSVEERISVLAAALRDRAGPALEERYLAPALRLLLSGEA